LTVRLAGRKVTIAPAPRVPLRGPLCPLSNNFYVWAQLLDRYGLLSEESETGSNCQQGRRLRLASGARQHHERGREQRPRPQVLMQVTASS
jgi:hypothetical protein